LKEKKMSEEKKDAVSEAQVREACRDGEPVKAPAPKVVPVEEENAPPKPVVKTLMVSVTDGRKISYASQGLSALEIAQIAAQLATWATEQMSKP
jgi:hypothetical protein